VAALLKQTEGGVVDCAHNAVRHSVLFEILIQSLSVDSDRLVISSRLLFELRKLRSQLRDDEINREADRKKQSDINDANRQRSRHRAFASAYAYWSLYQIDQRRDQISKEDRQNEKQNYGGELVEHPQRGNHCEQNEQDAQNHSRVQC